LSAERALRFALNGRPVAIDAPPHWTLLQLLRERLLAYEVKYGCGEGECGACAVLLDDEPVNACLLLAVHADGKSVTTARGLGGELVRAQGDASQPSRWAQRPAPLQEAFAEREAVQCGFCTPGMLVAAAHLLRTNPNPSREEIRAALAANLCRCTGYAKIVDAVAAAAAGLGERAEGSGDEET
jgi:aerobic carbon-monoxide dehydrogenase small subunit